MKSDQKSLLFLSRAPIHAPEQRARSYGGPNKGGALGRKGAQRATRASGRKSEVGIFNLFFVLKVAGGSVGPPAAQHPLERLLRS